MWKDFFYFSKADKRAIVLLLILIVCGLALCGWLSSQVEPPTEEESKEIDSFVTSVKEKGQRDSLQPFRYKKHIQQIRIEFAYFDPNEADSAALVRLGLPPFVAHNILRYRAKGGIFRSAEAFAKVYGLTNEQYDTLKPYIRIGEKYLPRERKDTLARRREDVAADTLRVLKYPEGTVIDLNKADTSELKKIPGIGSAYARQIVRYRDKLGGYHSVEQLHDLSFLPDDLIRWFKVEETTHPVIRINHWGVERLREHPYISFYQAKVIVEHRKKYGALKTLSQLSLYKEFADKDLERLAPYTDF